MIKRDYESSGKSTTGIGIALALLCALLVICSCSVRESKKKSSGRLANSNSLYLQEHADNPVAWYEWGNEALEAAERQNKPLIISIGYSSCHWCHVMEEQTFMDEEVAEYMNKNFIAIKVDREERPDIDKVYLHAAELMSGSSGWPLNAFALPNGKPFYAATYFDKDQWLQLLQQVAEAFRTDYHNLAKQADALTQGIKSSELISQPVGEPPILNEKNYAEIFSEWRPYLDYTSGGLKGSPKFPTPTTWEFLLQYHSLTGNTEALEAVTITLNNMANGGMFDHLGGGFFRYSTDSVWRIPHFEKMLSDNAQLVSLYSHAYQVTGKSLYREVITKTLDFIENEMTSSGGGFYTSIDADSDGEEGKFYAWEKAEVERILDSEQAHEFITYYNMLDSGNWEKGRNVLYKTNAQAIPTQNALQEAERLLKQKRGKRVRPSTDEKILTSWNALMLTAYVDAYFAIGDKSYLETALRNATFLETHVIRKDGSLSRNYQNMKATTYAFLDDYAFLANAFIRLYEATFDVHWLEQARNLTDYTIAHFHDKENEMFYYTSDLAEQLVVRKTELADNATPASTAILARALFFLGEYFNEVAYTRMSQAMLTRVGKDVHAGPQYASWAGLIAMNVFKPYEVAIVGDKSLEKNTQLRKRYLPLAIFMGGLQEDLPLLENKKVEGKTLIYVCRNRVCKFPVEDVEKALDELKIRHR